MVAASRLSSATRIRRAPPASGIAAAAGVPAGAPCTAGNAAGNGRRNVKVLPCPAPALAAPMLPPCIRTRLRTSASPIPRPPWARPMFCETWLNISNTLSRQSCGMPMPVPRTAITASPAARQAESVMRPPGGVYLQALVSRLASTCAARTGG